MFEKVKMKMKKFTRSHRDVELYGNIQNFGGSCAERIVGCHS